jgi:hypothetical protein
MTEQTTAAPYSHYPHSPGQITDMICSKPNEPAAITSPEEEATGFPQRLHQPRSTQGPPTTRKTKEQAQPVCGWCQKEIEV